MEGDGHAGGNRRRHRDISIHSLRMEGDKAALIYFVYSTGISIHSLRMEGDIIWRLCKMATTYISIHSLRMEGDGSSNQRYIDVKHFNPLPPHGGRPPSATQRPPIFSFQSTPSAWRETHENTLLELAKRNFNPLPPHGGRPCVHLRHYLGTYISIHSLRMEGDLVGFSVP